MGRLTGSHGSKGRAVFMKANQDGSSAYFKLEITAYKHGFTKLDNREYTVIEAKVVGSSCDQPGLGVGAIVSNVIKLGKFEEYFLSDNKAFLDAIGAAIPGEDLEDHVWEHCYGEAQPLVGRVICAEVFRKETTSGGTFDKVFYMSEDQSSHLNFAA